jgi:hypothetical protein
VPSVRLNAVLFWWKALQHILHGEVHHDDGHTFILF